MWQAWRPSDLALFAQRAFDPSLIWATVGLAGLLLISAIVIVVAGRWRRQQNEASASGDSTVNYQQLFEQGLLSREELERIRGRLEKGKTSAPSPLAGSSHVGPPLNVSEPPSSSTQAPSGENRPLDQTESH